MIRINFHLNMIAIQTEEISFSSLEHFCNTMLHALLIRFHIPICESHQLGAVLTLHLPQLSQNKYDSLFRDEVIPLCCRSPLLMPSLTPVPAFDFPDLHHKGLEGYRGSKTR